MRSSRCSKPSQYGQVCAVVPQISAKPECRASRRACPWRGARSASGPRQRRGDANGAVERLGLLDLGGHDLDAVAAEFRAAAGAQLGRVEAIVAENAVHLTRGVVARMGTVEYQDASARAAEHERGVETGRPGADDDAVPGPLSESLSIGSSRAVAVRGGGLDVASAGVSAGRPYSGLR